MKVLGAILILIVGSIIGCLLDYHGVKDPVIYYMLGSLSMLLAFTFALL